MSIIVQKGETEEQNGKDMHSDDPKHNQAPKKNKNKKTSKQKGTSFFLPLGNILANKSDQVYISLFLPILSSS